MGGRRSRARVYIRRLPHPAVRLYVHPSLTSSHSHTQFFSALSLAERRVIPYLYVYNINTYDDSYCAAVRRMARAHVWKRGRLWLAARTPRTRAIECGRERRAFAGVDLVSRFPPTSVPGNSGRPPFVRDARAAESLSFSRRIKCAPAQAHDSTLCIMYDWWGIFPFTGSCVVVVECTK